MGERAPAKSPGARRSRAWGVLVVIGVLLLAANLRTALTSVAPLIGEIRDTTGISNGAAGLLTTLPLLAFALLSPAAPRLASRFGMERALLASLLLLAGGILLRSEGAVAALFLGTVLLGSAIAVGNVLVPSFVKREFPERVGLMTSAYTTSLAISAAVAAGVSVPIAQLTGAGWRGSLALWAAPALLAVVAWVPLLRGGGGADASDHAARRVVGLWRSPLAWQVTMFMGLQSLAYYVTLTWLPEILKEEGMSVAAAGWLFALSQAIAIPSMSLAPVIAGRRSSQHGVVVPTVALSAAGILGLLLFGDSAATLWVVLLGLGQGASFSLALTFFALRSPDARHAAALSGMAQSIGYLFAAAGPFLFGVLRDATLAWEIPLILLLGVMVCLLISGLGAARDAHIATHDASREE